MRQKSVYETRVYSEFKAQGVDEFASVTIAIGEEEGDPDIVYAGKQAQLFAAQLRAGAKS